MFSDTPVATIVRFSGYTLSIALVTALLPVLIQQADVTVFDENGPIECLQLGFLILAGAIFIGIAYRTPAFRTLLIILACVCLFAVFRELDAILDKLLPLVGWQIGYVVVAGAAVLAWAQRDILKRQVTEFLSFRGFVVLWAGFVIAIPFSQLVGHGTFLELVMGDDYNRNYKRIIEETGELIGYLLIVAGSMEVISQVKPKRSSLSAPDDRST